jgi:hypothetical protein
MTVVDDLVNALFNFGDFIDFDPVELANALESAQDPTEALAAILNTLDPAGDAADALVDIAEEFILVPLEEEGRITPDNVEGIQDEIEGNSAAVIAGVIALTLFIESSTAGQFEELPQEIFQAVAALGFDDVTGREIEARLQNGIDPALKQKVHRESRSKQADFKDFTEANLRTKSFGGNVDTLSGDIPADYVDLFHPNDFGYLADPDTYGTVPEQTAVFETVGLDATEPEELIEEPVQYGIPVPLRAIEQITHVAGLPEDAKSVYTAVIEALPRTENLLQDYVRLTEFNFRLRESVQAGTITAEQARNLIEPELREIIKDAVPEDRLRPQDRSAAEVVDILADELQRNFELLQSLPPDPPTQGDIEAWFEKGVITSQQFQNLYGRFGSSQEAFGFYLQEAAIDAGADSVQEQFVLGRLSAPEARLRLRLIGFNDGEISEILSGADPSTIVSDRLTESGEADALPVSLASGVGDARSAQLNAVGVESLGQLSQLDVEELTSIVGVSDEQAQDIIDSATLILQQGAQ